MSKCGITTRFIHGNLISVNQSSCLKQVRLHHHTKKPTGANLEVRTTANNPM